MVIAVCRAVAPAGHSDDAAQEAWIRVLAVIRTLPDISRGVRGLVRRIALVEAIRFAEGKGGHLSLRADLILGEDALQSARSDEADPEERLLQAEVERVIVDEAMAVLTPKQRSALRLRVVEEKTASEVAALLGIDKGAAWRLCQRAGVRVLNALRGSA